MIDSNTKLTLLFLGVPIAGLIYCGLGIAAMLSFPVIREHPLISGAFFILIPSSIGGLVWLIASLKAYKKN